MQSQTGSGITHHIPNHPRRSQTLWKSQWDFGPEPWVARNELPWVSATRPPSTATRLRHHFLFLHRFHRYYNVQRLLPVSKPVGDDVRRLKYPAPKFLVRVSSPRLLQIEGVRADRELTQLAVVPTRSGWDDARRLEQFQNSLVWRRASDCDNSHSVCQDPAKGSLGWISMSALVEFIRRLGRIFY